MAELFQLKCRECARLWGNIPLSYCQECLSPLEITYDYEALRGRVTRESIARRPANLWRYSDLLPLWSEWRYFPFVYSREAVEKNTTDRLSLQP